MAADPWLVPHAQDIQSIRKAPSPVSDSTGTLAVPTRPTVSMVYMYDGVYIYIYICISGGSRYYCVLHEDRDADGPQDNGSIRSDGQQ